MRRSKTNHYVKFFKFNVNRIVVLIKTKYKCVLMKKHLITVMHIFLSFNRPNLIADFLFYVIPIAGEMYAISDRQMKNAIACDSFTWKKLFA